MEYLQTFLKALLAFASLLGVARILGKKQIGQLTLFDYITGITMGTLAAAVVIEEAWTRPLLGLVAWAALSFLMHRLNLRGRSINRATDGAPTILVRGGQVLEQALRKEQLTLSHLMSLLRQSGCFNVQEVEFALLETDGTLSVLPKSQYRPVQPRDLHLPTAYEGLPIQLMQEGRLIPHGLKQAGLSAAWLKGELARRQAEPETVFAAWLDTRGALHLDRYEGRGS
jgi:uncharacterized membrane protein YcaP (DUF421 family)